MPLYSFDCRHCGSFDAFAPVTDAAAAASCPGCGAPARRRFTPPAVALMARPLRRALDREEQSAHEPAVVKQRTGRPMPHRHGHGASPPWMLSH